MKWLFKNEFSWLEVLVIGFVVQFPWDSFKHFIEVLCVLIILGVANAAGRRYYNLHD